MYWLPYLMLQSSSKPSQGNFWNFCVSIWYWGAHRTCFLLGGPLARFNNQATRPHYSSALISIFWLKIVRKKQASTHNINILIQNRKGTCKYSRSIADAGIFSKARTKCCNLFSHLRNVVLTFFYSPASNKNPENPNLKFLGVKIFTFSIPALLSWALEEKGAGAFHSVSQSKEG